MKKRLVNGKLLNNFLFIFFLVMPFVTSIDSHADDSDPTVDIRSETVTPDLFTGTASYSIPIKVPFGRNNMNPNLALTYHSTNGNGWLGVGWELEVGSIEKARKDVASLGTGFYLRSSGSAIALFDNSAVAGAGSFSPVIEGEFNRVQQLPATDGQTYWVVTSKAGVTYRYGYTSASRQDDIGIPDDLMHHPANPANIFKWCLDQIQDTNGNIITYKYFKDQNQIYLDEIDYTANGTTIGSTNCVKFYRESGRFDAPIMFTTGFSVTTAYRLKSIDVVANTNQVSTRVRSYALGYNTATAPNTPTSQTSSITGRSLLTTVAEYGSDAVLNITTGPGRVTAGTSLPPITLGYQATDQTLNSTGSIWTTQTWTGPASGVPIGNQCVPGDFNGDGLTDLLCNQGNGSWDVYLSTGTGWSMTSYSTDFVITNPLTNYCFAGDFYGIGTSQLACYSASSGAWSVLSFNKDSSGALIPQSSLNIISGLPATVPIGNQCISGSFQVGGQSDIACYSSATGWQDAHYDYALLYSYHRPSTAFVVTSMTAQAQDNNNCFSGNFTGSGNFVYACYSYANDNWQVSGNIWRQPCPVPANYYDGIIKDCLTGDFNGDGITDIVCSDAYGGSSMALSTGSSWYYYPEPWDAVRAWAWGPFPLGLQCVAGDFNGDGITDLACYFGSGASWKFGLSTGTGWSEQSWSGPQLPYSLDNYSVGAQCITGDFNGDGKTDIACLAGTGSTNTWNVVLSHTYPTDLLSSISNGVGGYTTIQYTPSTQYSNTQLPFPIQVVSNVKVCDNYQGSGCVGNWSETDYTYAGGFYYNPTHEFRGFNYVMQTNPAGPSGERTITETRFHQGNDLTVGDNNPNVTKGFMKGKPYEVRVSDGYGNLISDTTTTYVDTNPIVYQGAIIISGGTPPYFTPSQEVDTYITDCNPNNPCSNTTNARQTRTVYQYDSYGNNTREDRYGDVNNPADPLLNMTITRSYLPNLTNWIVGLPANESVFQGIGTTNAGSNLQVSHTDYYYDDLIDCVGAPTNNQTPSKGNLTRIVKWLDKGGSSPEYRMAYDSNNGNILCTSDPNGNVTRTGYDPNYSTFPITSTNAKNQMTTFGYYGVGTATGLGTYGQLINISDPNTPAATVGVEYDVNSRKSRVIQPDGVWTGIYYNSFGTVGSQNVTATNHQLGIWSSDFFDGLGRTIETLSIGPVNNSIVTYASYDQRGNVSKVSVPSFNIGTDKPVYKSYTYDAVGRVTTTTYPDDKGGNQITQSCYSDLISVFIDENGHRKRYIKDPLGRLVKVEEYTGVYATCDTTPLSPYATTNYTYDVLGNLTGVTDTHNNATIINYDSLGRKINMTDPDMGTWIYTYDNVGNLLTQKDAKQQTITFTYDPLNRLKTKHYPTGPDVVITYDDPTTSTYPIGRLTKMADASGQTQTVYNYDSSGRTTSITRTIGGQTYNPLIFSYTNGQLAGITYPDPDNEYVSYGYDQAGNLQSVGNYVSYSNFDALGRPGVAVYENNAGGVGNAGATSYSYYPINKHLQNVTFTSSAGTLINNNYGYDYKGNVTSITDNLNITLPNNFSSDSYTPATGHVHAVGSTGSGRQFVYDNNGNKCNDKGYACSDLQNSINYNYENMPTTIPTSIGNIGFVYDGNGTRVQKVNLANNNTTVYLDKLFECTNGYCDKHIYGIDGRIAIKTATSTFYLHGDHLGSTSVVTDNAGNQKGSIAYYPFGEKRSDDSSVYLNYKYTGQELDSETGLYNYNARLYDPSMGRFLTPDTIVPDPTNPQSLNRYSYVMNNPLNFTDPSGHCDCEPDELDCYCPPDEPTEPTNPTPPSPPAPPTYLGNGSYDATIGLSLNYNPSSIYSYSVSIDTSSFGNLYGSGMPNNNTIGGSSLSLGGLSTLHSVVTGLVNTGGNPWVNNTLTILSGSGQVAAGLAIGGLTSETGLGLYAGGLIVAQGAASVGTSIGNLYNLYKGIQPSVNNSGLVGLTTSLATLGTSSQSANNKAMAADMGINILLGRVGPNVANAVISARISAGTLDYEIMNLTKGVGNWIPEIKSAGRSSNIIDVLSAYSNFAGAWR